MNSDSPKVSGTSIGRAIDVPDGLLYDETRAVVRLIDRVHGVGNLPTVRVRLSSGVPERGRFTFESSTGEPISIVVDPSDPLLRLVFLHEVGHFIDLSAFGVGPIFGSTMNESLGSWRRAVQESRSHQALLRIAITGIVSCEPGPESESLLTLEDSERAAVATLLLLEELWARSYAQYVAVRSGDSGSLNHLAVSRMRRPGKVYYPRQWGDDEFPPIADAIDRLFVDQGWRR